MREKTESKGFYFKLESRQHKQLKQLALDRESNVTQLIREAIQLLLEINK